MLSLAPPKPISLFLQPHPSFSFNLRRRPLNLRPHHSKPHHRYLVKPISATTPSSSQFPTSPSSPNQVYQPFRPPPRQDPSLSADAIIDVLSNRLGLWYDYATLIPILSRHHSFSPSAIEESTGISGIEQNRLVVSSQVRDSLVSSSVDPDTLSFFDIGGAELLYELRLLSAPQRAAAARRIAALRFDPKAAQELARAMKDFPRRRADDGWDCFSPVPGDCLAFMHLRQSREYSSAAERSAALERAMAEAETERARLRISHEMRKGSDGEDGDDGNGAAVVKVSVPIVRMRTGEVAEATTVAVLPVVREAEASGESAASAVLDAPGCRTVGQFGVVVADKGWMRWVVLPGWDPLVGLGKGGVVVGFSDGRVLPWKANRGYMEEEILVVVDRERKEVLEDEGFYLVVNGEKGGLSVMRGDRLKERGVKESLGMVVLVVRPPKEEIEDQLPDDDWE